MHSIGVKVSGLGPGHCAGFGEPAAEHHRLCDLAVCQAGPARNAPWKYLEADSPQYRAIEWPMLNKVVPEAVYAGVIELSLGEGVEQCIDGKGGDESGIVHLEIENGI